VIVTVKMLFVFDLHVCLLHIKSLRLSYHIIWWNIWRILGEMLIGIMKNKCVFAHKSLQGKQFAPPEIQKWWQAKIRKWAPPEIRK
jgi:hypothetical protein